MVEQPINWTTIIVAAIAGLPATIGAFAALIVAIRTLKVSKETKKNVQEVAKSTNGRMGQLIEASKAEGELTAIKRQIEAGEKSGMRRASDREALIDAVKNAAGAAAAAAAVEEISRRIGDLDDPTPQKPAPRSTPD